ncbi:MAG: radical SAM protein [Candidatus Aenigmarchaeota archaeon]|nr:radical SAM protein [Candidatus Aenigmarchaeota archaeon]
MPAKKSPKIHRVIRHPYNHALVKTQSVCPECQKVLPAEIFERDGKVWIKKTCSTHGDFEELYWGDYQMYEKARSFARDGKGVSNPNVEKENPICPNDCGLCKMHKSHTALANIVVTNRCDLACWYCFYYAQKMGYVYEPTLEQIRFMVKNLVNEKPVPCNAVQLTGGEPTMREDLIEIIKICKEGGIDHVQLNTNGIRLSQSPALAMRVREAGVNILYMSFDGVTEKTNPKNHWEVPKAMENCRKAGIGIVLVPTVIKGVNDHELGDILRFGFKNNDVIRGVNYQPVSLVGRMPKKERDNFRITIPDAIKSIEEQTKGEVSREDFYPVPSVMPITNFVEAITKKQKYSLSTHFSCGMATYVFNDNGKMLPITRFVDVEGLFRYLDTLADDIRRGKNRYKAGLNLMFKLNSFIDKQKQPKGFSLSKVIYNALMKHDYSALGEFHHKSLFVGMMHFMDQYNYDVERVKRCCIHYATPDPKMPIIPFCAFNVMPDMYREPTQKKFSLPIPKWEEKTGRKLRDDFYRRGKP